MHWESPNDAKTTNAADDEMKDQVPTNVINGICISVLDLQDRLRRSDKSIRSSKGENKKEKQIDEEKKGEDSEKNVVEEIKEANEENEEKTKNSLFSYENLGLCVAELIGTALLLFFGCMGCITDYEGVHIPHYMPSVSFGLTVMLVIQIFGHISGAHVNPQVTLATVLLGMLDIKVVPVYLIGQFAGAALGLAGLKMLVPGEYIAQEIYNAQGNLTATRLGICTTAPHHKVSTMQALIMETIITAVLILICCSIWDKRNGHKQDSVPLRFGLAIATIAIAAGPFCGASMNTARSFAPALLNGDWKDQWIYWVGPTAGSLLAVFFYKSMYSLPKEQPVTKGQVEELQELRTTNA